MLPPLLRHFPHSHFSSVTRIHSFSIIEENPRIRSFDCCSANHCLICSIINNAFVELIATLICNRTQEEASICKTDTSWVPSSVRIKFEKENNVHRHPSHQQRYYSVSSRINTTDINNSIDCMKCHRTKCQR